MSAGCTDSERKDDAALDGSSPLDSSSLLDAAMDARTADAAGDRDGDTPDAGVQRDGSIVLAAFPLDILRCSGRDYGDGEDDGGVVGGFFGQCCDKVMCYASDPSIGCLDASAAGQEHFSFGSGDCNCGEIRGPYARPDDGARTEGDCCYAVSVIACTGRPLTTEHGHLLAALVSDTAWIV